ACKTGLYILFNKGVVSHQRGRPSSSYLPPREAYPGSINWETGGGAGATGEAPPPRPKKEEGRQADTRGRGVEGGGWEGSRYNRVCIRDCRGGDYSVGAAARASSGSHTRADARGSRKTGGLAQHRQDNLPATCAPACTSGGTGARKGGLRRQLRRLPRGRSSRRRPGRSEPAALAGGVERSARRGDLAHYPRLPPGAGHAEIQPQ